MEALARVLFHLRTFYSPGESGYGRRIKFAKPNFGRAVGWWVGIGAESILIPNDSESIQNHRF